MAEVVLTDVEKVYPDGTRAVTDLNLRIDDGHLLVVVGPSGCGKTTALRMVAGLEEITSGTVHIGDRVVNKLEPGERDVAMVFQNYALYPHMTVYGNINFPLRLARVPKEARDRKVREAARVLGLENHLKRKPPQLSGGQRQRVAMGRAIVREPAVFLMDEPLSNLDAKLRVQMRAEISAIQRRFGVTTLYVTHDQVEAMTIGDRVAVMRNSRLQQVDDPQTIYDRPANLFVASFVGSPPMNLFQAAVERTGDGIGLVVGEQRLDVDEQELAAHPPLGSRAGAMVVVGVRPERLGTSDAPPQRRLRGGVVLCEALGSDSLAYVMVKGSLALDDAQSSLANDVEDAAEVEELSRETQATVVARLDPRIPMSAGEPIEIGVGAGSLYFFDPDTGLALTGE
ncbi:MAG TPA: sn-glycerol-3-phosphate ABC transporter ATP-binding protein UgpC [Gaiellales bacterium]|jgi:multiple sugar transport system ATP-binding protein|nr:sn-glycerol-3-phosphate ABC transporter ATP-binding protein UgpC [Gaiellales bacterium]